MSVWLKSAVKSEAVLSPAQERIVSMVNDKKFTVEHCERYYREDPHRLCVRSRCGNDSFFVVAVREVNAFMAAIDGIIQSVR